MPRHYPKNGLVDNALTPAHFALLHRISFSPLELTDEQRKTNSQAGAIGFLTEAGYLDVKSVAQLPGSDIGRWRFTRSDKQMPERTKIIS